MYGRRERANILRFSFTNILHDKKQILVASSRSRPIYLPLSWDNKADFFMIICQSRMEQGLPDSAMPRTPLLILTPSKIKQIISKYIPSFAIINLVTFMNAHPSFSAYPGSGQGGSGQSKSTQTSLSPAVFSSSS